MKPERLSEMLASVPRHACGKFRAGTVCPCLICSAVAAGATKLAATEAVRKRPKFDAGRLTGAASRGMVLLTGAIPTHGDES